MQCPTCHADGHNPLCGDSIQIFLIIEKDLITDISFEGAGCALCIASASLMTEVIKNKTINEAKNIFKRFHALATGKSNDDNGLGKLGVFGEVNKYPARVKCTTLAWHTFIAALEKKSDE
jgi:nitrogen fixation NifU-like protein